ncbi:MAG: Hsp33 family molecular chaperone HslO [Oligoflexia bacterium]|nr:Hsp33 family molecular chaperone HslO [Oligoflexia bacterium]
MNKTVIERFISDDGTVVASSVIATSVIEEARMIHNTMPVASAALGRALIGAGLLATFMKENGRIALYFKGDGPLGNLFAEGSSDGSVRGFVNNPQIHVPSKNGKLNVGEGIGKGMLSVATSLPHEKQPYTGTVEIQSGEIGEDIAYYLLQSQQVPSIVALGVFVEPDNSVSAAGGTIVQVMPGVKDETLGLLEKRVKEMKTVTEQIRAGASTSDLAFEILEDLKFRKLDQTFSFHYSCQCSSVRVERSLLLLGSKELQELVDKKESTEVRCDFCGRKYSVDLDTLIGLLGLSKKKS